MLPIFFSIVIVFNGFSVFIGIQEDGFDFQAFITSYIGVPVFFGLYYGIRSLSKHDPGGFLWLNNLSEPDPYHVLPILAGVFQFAQTKMMRPHGSPKITDPQQQMMQSMMTFMPIMVVLFGWRFASGPVLYWTTQSVYSVVQQWFITGWGALKDWVPFLPDLPAHRRLGHRKTPLTRAEPGTTQPKGLFARMQAHMLEQQQDPKARRAAAGASVSNGVDDLRAAGGGDSGAGLSTGKRARRARGSGVSATDTTISGGAGDDLPISPPKTVPRRTRAPSANGVPPDANADNTGSRRRK